MAALFRCRQYPQQVPARLQVWPCGILTSSRQEGDFNHLNFNQVHSAICGTGVSYSSCPQSRPGPRQKPASSTRWVTWIGIFPAQPSSETSRTDAGSETSQDCARRHGDSRVRSSLPHAQGLLLADSPSPPQECRVPFRQTLWQGALRLVLLHARARDNKVRASDPSARALHGHALTASAHLDLPSSESFSWAVSACSCSGRDTGGQRSRAWADLSFCHLRAQASTLMPRISHIASISPEPLSRPFILHVLLISLCFLTPFPSPEPCL